jgi:hypothetical protein
MNPAAVTPFPGTPFPKERVRTLLIANATGALLLAAGTAGTAHGVSPNDQMAWLNLAAAGLVVGVVGNGAFLRNARRMIRQQTRRLDRSLR